MNTGQENDGDYNVIMCVQVMNSVTVHLHNKEWDTEVKLWTDSECWS